MKKSALITVLLILPVCLFAAYTPSISVKGGADFVNLDQVDPDTTYRFSGNVGCEVNILSFSFGNNKNNKISFPVTGEWHSMSQVVGRKFLQERFTLDIALRYDRDITRFWSLGFAVAPGVTYYYKGRSGNIYLALDLNNDFFFNRMISIGVPLRLTISQSEIDYHVGLSFTVYFLGNKGKSKIGGILIEN